MSDRLITNIDEHNAQSEKEYDENVSRLVYQKSKLEKEKRNIFRLIAEYEIRVDDINEYLRFIKITLDKM
tara:strand:+ start:682 stop:891 length:210 start_codon:yes stop_codon:yes gene_type:complete